MLPGSGIIRRAQMIPPAFMATRSAVCTSAAWRICFPDRTHAAIQHSIRPNATSAVPAVAAPMKGTSATRAFCCGNLPRSLHHNPWYNQTSAIEARISLGLVMVRSVTTYSSFVHNDEVRDRQTQWFPQAGDLQTATLGPLLHWLGHRKPSLDLPSIRNSSAPTLERLPQRQRCRPS
jgi:hypothetical protein